MKLKYVALAAVIILLCASQAFAQASWGDVAEGQGLIDWLMESVMVKVITIALLGAIMLGVWQQSILAGVGAFLVICVIGGVVGFVPGIAEGLVNGG